ncbi:MAG TPA: GNAT family N-acetyltransferase, partial [Burkholderiaceae bacterium]|nr:GNAT family N-acetyltransferase [Burkholderiaceae bacterium]
MSSMPDVLTAEVLVRDAAETDMQAIQAIYAHHVLHGLATFEEVPPS